MEMSALDIGYVVSKLKGLEGGRLEKIYQVGKKEFIFSIHKGGKHFVKVVLGKGVFFVNTKEDVDKASLFSMFLRKRLKQSKLRKVYQEGFERIVVLEFDAYNIILELFSKGDLILADKSGNIEIVAERQSWKDRELKKDVKYEFPERRFDLYIATADELKKMLAEIKRDSLVKALAVDFGLGGEHAEFVCLKAKVDKFATRLSEEEISKLVDVVKDLREFKFFNKNFEFDAAEKFKVKNAYEEEIERVELMIKEQKEHLEELKKDVDLYRIIGDEIYKNYNMIDDLIKEIVESKWKVKNPKIKEIKAAEGKIILEL